MRASALLFLCAVTLAADVVIEKAPREDPALRQAVDALRLALGAGGGKVTLRGVPDWSGDASAASQGFRIEPGEGGLVVESDGVGLVYGAFRLAERIRRDGFRSDLRIAEQPAFPERMFSYEGTVLDLPDEGYYFRDRPYANPYTLRQQTDAARTAMRRLVSYGFNSVTFLHLNLEDYVNYDLLGDGLQVYAADSLHRARSKVFCAMMRDLTAYAHQLHLRLYIQIYDFSFPDHLDGRKLTDNSEFAWQIVEARLTEMLQRTGVDGLVVTATEPSPRLNYRGFQLWKTPEGAGRMAQRYQQIIVGKNKRRMVFRTWRVANDMATFERVLSAAPDPEIVYDAKSSDGDFFLNVGDNRLLAGGAAAKRPFMITFDAFREYDGWGRTVLYPKFWAERFRLARRQGVKIVDAWGPWIPGCIYPGVWVGKYDHYDSLRQEYSPAEPMLYLFARLAWDPEQSVDGIAADWARLHFGKQAPAVEKALAKSEELWRTSYIGPTPHGGLAFKWTMLFQARPPLIERVGKEWTTETILDSNRRAMELAVEIRGLLSGVNAARTPSPEMAREMQRAGALTELYFRTFTLWREVVFRVHRAGTKPTAGERAAIRAVVARLESVLPEWKSYPQEATNWLVLEFDPNLATAPDWMQRTSVTETIQEWKRRFASE